MKLNLNLRFFYAVIILVAAASLRANEVQNLLGQLDRPTIKQVREKLALDGSLQPVQSDLLNSNVAYLIAEFENAFPGAIWLPLGRDASRLGDLLDAFYQAIGHDGRVRRINLSTSSFNTQESIADYIEQLGWDPMQIDNNPPFVLFDRTSYGTSSQSTKVMTEVYQRFMSKTGRPASDLLGKFFIISTDSGDALPHPRGNPWSVAVPSFLHSISQASNHLGRPSTKIYMKNGSGWTDGDEWHNPFGPLRRAPDGSLVTDPGPSAHASQARTNILNYQISIARGAMVPDFIEAVKQNARQMGFEFQMGAYKPVPPLSPEERERRQAVALKESLKKLQDSLGPKPESYTGYLSPNAIKYQQWLDSAESAPTYFHTLAIRFLKAVVEAHEKGVLGERDLRRLVARAIGRANLPDEKFSQRFSEIISNYEPLKRAFTEKRSVFTESKQKDAESVRDNFLILEEFLKCQSIIGSFSDVGEGI